MGGNKNILSKTQEKRRNEKYSVLKDGEKEDKLRMAY